LNLAIRYHRLLWTGAVFALGGLSATVTGWQRQQSSSAVVTDRSAAVCQTKTSGSRSEVDARLVLAPSGKLRVGVFPSPTSVLHDRVSGEVKGVTVEVGRELARRLGVAMELVEFPQVTGVLDAMSISAVDVTIAAAARERATSLAYSSLVFGIDAGYIVSARSSISTADKVDRRGVRVGATAGAWPFTHLSTELKEATLLPVPSPAAAMEMIAAGTLDAYATNKALLTSLAAASKDARILEGGWGVENLVIAIPRPREQCLAYVNSFVQSIKADGLISAAATRANVQAIVRQ
jgi:polar amino acid transport system substrate-binding protein